MQLIFLIWPILLLPVFVTWLTRPRPVAPPRSSTQRRAAANSAAAPSPVVRKPVPQTAAAERCRNSPAYRRAAMPAYETIQALDMEEEDDDATSPAVQLHGKDDASSRS
ncbi:MULTISPECIES: hypothetical protein [unclassified Herbaspirillum]|uniref:hypothetical protein n=1 Tax=unclassified Herbaspirillum TaxID=2624150 RepID=UPI000E2E813D|nr:MULTISPECIES: hypothetical protein [unclassified Herbaspirillum]RFB73582.1 hypothetical protein DZB54_04570 [Herbaspirillum sp. 3R-3a1]TFI10617.1 hypothetical protein E4P32_03595 [Herbaspirillum sp. 3R11]TFI16524.1 hypothetical protein E4P31_03600 [Herbaspirillum sp. 3R-11]TFI23769.1 hypothetical protein E4P30_16700 [Herbaspirillum sp. 3C11]